MATPSDVIRIASAEVGYYRHDDPQQGTKYGRWYAQKTNQPAYAANGVPFCAMFVSWVFDHAGQQVPGLPTAYVPYLQRDAAGLAVDKTSAQQCDIVIFQWDSGETDHVGIVEFNRGTYIQTIEGNVNGGRVKRRTRSWNVVAMVIRPQWSNSGTKLLNVDGMWGANTTRRLQEVLGTTVDGVISGQIRCAENENIYSAQWGSGGSDAIERMSEAFGITDMPRNAGPKFIAAYLMEMNGRVGNGRIDAVSDAVKEMQRRLNAGYWKN